MYKTLNYVVGFAAMAKDKIDVPLWSLCFVPEGDKERVVMQYRAFARAWIGTVSHEVVACEKKAGQILALIWGEPPQMVDADGTKTIYARFIVQGVEFNSAIIGKHGYPVYNNIDDAWRKWDDFWRVK